MFNCGSCLVELYKKCIEIDPQNKISDIETEKNTGQPCRILFKNLSYFQLCLVFDAIRAKEVPSFKDIDGYTIHGHSQLLLSYSISNYVFCKCDESICQVNIDENNPNFFPIPSCEKFQFDADTIPESLFCIIAQSAAYFYRINKFCVEKETRSWDGRKYFFCLYDFAAFKEAFLTLVKKMLYAQKDIDQNEKRLSLFLNEVIHYLFDRNNIEIKRINNEKKHIYDTLLEEINSNKIKQNPDIYKILDDNKASGLFLGYNDKILHKTSLVLFLEKMSFILKHYFCYKRNTGMYANPNQKIELEDIWINFLNKYDSFCYSSFEKKNTILYFKELQIEKIIRNIEDVQIIFKDKMQDEWKDL